MLVIAAWAHVPALAAHGLPGNGCLEEANTSVQSPKGAFHTGTYRNLFHEYLGIPQAETTERIQQLWHHFFEDEKNKVYFDAEDGTAYIYDTGSRDVRTEGMSYGMMICVQLNKQAEFDKIWRWAQKHMHYTTGKWKGYFAWQCKTNGEKIGGKPSCAIDKKAYFITALFFASHRWGNNGAINYEAEAQRILKDVMSKDGSSGVYNMFDHDSKLITFVPAEENRHFTDPSYNLPAFFELWARWSDTNQDFWLQTAQASRDLLAKASHPETGLFPDYSTFEGRPHQPTWKTDYDARRYQFDAIRCAMNIGMDAHWFGTDLPRQKEMMTRLLKFFQKDGYTHAQFNVDGTGASGNYTEGMAGANAVGCFALDNTNLIRENLKRLWNTPPPTGVFRYYTGMVYMLSMLHVTGHFRIYAPAQEGK